MKHNKLMRKAISEANKEKPKKCPACNGSGRYDAKSSPKCGACNGTGEVK